MQQELQSKMVSLLPPLNGLTSNVGSDLVPRRVLPSRATTSSSHHVGYKLYERTSEPTFIRQTIAWRSGRCLVYSANVIATEDTNMHHTDGKPSLINTSINVNVAVHLGSDNQYSFSRCKNIHGLQLSPSTDTLGYLPTSNLCYTCMACGIAYFKQKGGPVA